jgi:hypothetical protein
MEEVLFVDTEIASEEAHYGKKSEREAWRLFNAAIEATRDLLEFYKENPKLFRKVASRLSLLPCFMSWHPDAQRFNRRLLEFSRLGRCGICYQLRNNPRYLIKQPSPVWYAYAMINTIVLTHDTYGEDLPRLARVYGYGVKHPISRERIEAALAKLTCSEEKKQMKREEYRGAYEVLPCWTRGLESLPRPFNKDHVLDYWRVGKAMILEEMPDFHERPEWQRYRDNRNYRSGAKKGAIQHAIFKDILAALKTIAGSGKRKRPDLS